MTSLVNHRAARTPASPLLAPAGRVLGAPIEKITEPPTGCPSAEITRQLSTCVPRAKLCGTFIVTVWFSASAGPSGIGAPSGPMRCITSGDTGSLKVKLTEAGARGMTAPSAGDALSNEACAQAGGARARPPHKGTRNAAPRAGAQRHIFGKTFRAGPGPGQ